VHHGVEITDPAIVAAATLSNRYIPDRQLPDKAIDLMDEAASRIRMEIDSKPEEMDRLERRLIQLKIQREALKKEKDAETKQRLNDLEDEIDKLEREFSDLEEVWKAEKAAVQGSTKLKEADRTHPQRVDAAMRRGISPEVSELQYGKLPQLEKQLAAAQETEQKGFKLLQQKVTADEIAEVVSRWTGIPVSKMLEGERDKLLRMEAELHRRVVGQDEAVARCPTPSAARAPACPIRTARTVPSCSSAPPASARPSCARRWPNSCSTPTDAMVRIDMSEFMEKHSVSRLIGAPPGYVGYEEGGYLTEAVRRRPYSVILLDEVEKAHPDVFNVLLQVLDDGRLTDGQGRTVDFRNTVIVMTSNLGSQLIQEWTRRATTTPDEGGGDGRGAGAFPPRVHQPPRRDRGVPPARSRTHPQHRAHPVGASREAAGGTRHQARDQRQRARSHRQRRFRPGLRRAPAQAHDPEPARKPAGQTDPAGPVRRRRHRGRRPIQRGVAVPEGVKTPIPPPSRCMPRNPNPRSESCTHARRCRWRSPPA
jgi:hypothetical protein